jgi:hypothetical protein
MAADPKRDGAADEVDQLHRAAASDETRRRDRRSPVAENGPIKEPPAQAERDRVEEDRFEATDN